MANIVNNNNRTIQVCLADAGQTRVYTPDDPHGDSGTGMYSITGTDADQVTTVSTSNAVVSSSDETGDWRGWLAPGGGDTFAINVVIPSDISIGEEATATWTVTAYGPSGAMATSTVTAKIEVIDCDGGGGGGAPTCGSSTLSVTQGSFRVFGPTTLFSGGTAPVKVISYSANNGAIIPVDGTSKTIVSGVTITDTSGISVSSTAPTSTTQLTLRGEDADGRQVTCGYTMTIEAANTGGPVCGTTTFSVAQGSTRVISPTSLFTGGTAPVTISSYSANNGTVVPVDGTPKTIVTGVTVTDSGIVVSSTTPAGTTSITVTGEDADGRIVSCDITLTVTGATTGGTVTCKPRSDVNYTSTMVTQQLPASTFATTTGTGLTVQSVTSVPSNSNFSVQNGQLVINSQLPNGTYSVQVVIADSGSVTCTYVYNVIRAGGDTTALTLNCALYPPRWTTGTPVVVCGQTSFGRLEIRDASGALSQASIDSVTAALSWEGTQDLRVRATVAHGNGQYSIELDATNVTCEGTVQLNELKLDV